VLDVEGVISSDRRYVTMTVIFDFAEFLGFRQSSAAEFGGAAGGGGTGGGNAAEFTGAVELPILRGSRLRTTVSVPDKGTVLLGGQRSVNETEVEAGVPVLSKIPFINRFFTNRISSKTEQTLLILIRPEIIIQQENEDLLFPGLGDSIGASASYLR
jgi:general secretion pathway protein D